MTPLVLFLFLTGYSFPPLVDCTEVDKCQGLQVGSTNAVYINICERSPCTVIKGTFATIQINFSSNYDVAEAVQSIDAVIFGMPFEFPGVDGTSACPFIYESDGVTPAGCPLKAGVQYVYIYPMEIKSWYPEISPNVHWALVNSITREEIACFEIQICIRQA